MKVEVDVLGPNSPYGLCGRKATLNLNCDTQSSAAVCESRLVAVRMPLKKQMVKTVTKYYIYIYIYIYRELS